MSATKGKGKSRGSSKPSPIPASRKSTVTLNSHALAELELAARPGESRTETVRRLAALANHGGTLTSDAAILHLSKSINIISERLTFVESSISTRLMGIENAIRSMPDGLARAVMQADTELIESIQEMTRRQILLQGQHEDVKDTVGRLGDSIGTLANSVGHHGTLLATRVDKAVAGLSAEVSTALHGMTGPITTLAGAVKALRDATRADTKPGTGIGRMP